MLWALIVGLLVGAIAKFLMPGKDPGGFLVTMLLGLGGSMLAYWIGTSTGRYYPGETVGIFASVLGALVILVLYRMLSGKRRRI